MEAQGAGTERGGFSLHGLTLPLGPNDVSPVIWQALQAGKYEAKEARHVAALLRAGDRVLELGTGIGVITCLMAQVEGVKIWSFDANPHTVALAERVARANGVIGTAGGDGVTFGHRLMMVGAPKSYPFYLRRDFWMSSMIEAQGPYEEVIEVGSEDIDAFIAAQDINVLVMDIEGAERSLLAEADLSRIDRVFLELHDHLYGLQGLREIFAAMAAKGFGYDPRNSSGPCVQFSRDLGEERSYCES